MTTPLVSVLMTVYNREKYIAEAIESVLASTYTNFELIIVDDCSTDKSIEIARKYEAKDERIKVYINEKNLGDYPNRNRAASYATGRYIKYLDSDDIIYSHGLQVMVEAMEKFPEAALGIPNHIIEDKKPYPFLISSRESYIQHFLKSGIFGSGPTGTIIQRKKFREIDYFGKDTYVGSDTIAWLRLAALYPIVRIAPSLFWWRTHEGQEIVKGNVSGEYINKNFKYLFNILQSESCPLNEIEKKEAIRLLKKRFITTVVRIFWKSPIKIFRMLTNNSITVSDILKSIPQAKKNYEFDK